MIIIPIGDTVFVKRDETSDVTSGGIAMPDSHRSFKFTGEVVAVGPGMLRVAYREGDSDRMPMQCKVGDRVVVPGSTQPVQLDESNPKDVLFCCPERTLLAILRD